MQLIRTLPTAARTLSRQMKETLQNAVQSQEAKNALSSEWIDHFCCRVPRGNFLVYKNRQNHTI